MIREATQADTFALAELAVKCGQSYNIRTAIRIS